MPNVLIRDIDPAALERLKARAKSRGRSLQAEMKEILETAAGFDMERFRRIAAESRAETAGRIQTDSADLIREGREERGDWDE
jgi:plasmid stability protein